MKLLKKICQSRRDFTGRYECEGCGDISEIEGGYDDANFHKNVMPNRRCKKCNESTNTLGIDVEHVEPRYPEGYTIE